MTTSLFLCTMLLNLASVHFAAFNIPCLSALRHCSGSDKEQSYEPIKDKAATHGQTGS